MPEPKRDVAPLPFGVRAGPFKITGIYETRQFSFLYAASGPQGPVILEEFVPPGAVREYDGTLKPGDVRSAPLYTEKLNRFKTASKTMGTVLHPNVVRLSGSFRHGETSFRVFPWIPRRTLATYLQSLPEHALRPALAPGLLEPLLGALEAGHALNIVHHSLSPYTVWMSGTGELLLSSFGDVYLEIREGYSAPELYTPVRGAIGPRTDLYSLAATAVKALTASHPPSAARRREFTAAGGPDPMDLPLGQLRGVLDKGIHEAVSRSLRLNWEERPQSVQEFRKIMAGRTAPKPSPAPTRTVAPPAPHVPHPDPEASPAPVTYPEPVASASYPDPSQPPVPVPYPGPATSVPYPDPSQQPAPVPYSDPSQQPGPESYQNPMVDGQALFPLPAVPFTDPATAAQSPYPPAAGPFTDSSVPPMAGPFADPAASPTDGPFGEPTARLSAMPYQDSANTTHSAYPPAAGPFIDPVATTADGPFVQLSSSDETVPYQDYSATAQSAYPPAAGPFTDPLASPVAESVADHFASVQSRPSAADQHVVSVREVSATSTALPASPVSEDPEVFNVPLDQIQVEPWQDAGQPQPPQAVPAVDAAAPDYGELPPGFGPDSPPVAAPSAAPDYGEFPPGFGPDSPP
ncbi:MAG: hypothetical protein LBT40_00735, partial [Deltaproteobacteria bacterium]|nr:hypothetical protein [Deltaproteobacteria bacterium]